MNDCAPEWESIHAEIMDIGTAAAELALSTYHDGADDENVIAASVTMVLVDVYTVDPGRLRCLLAEFRRHARRLIDQRLAQ